VVVEVKLGANAELAGLVAGQLSDYVELVANHFEEFKACYEAVYAQKHALGLLGDADLLGQVRIVAPVEGWIVAQGRRADLAEPMKQLKQKHSDVKLVPFDYDLFDSAGNLRQLCA
jgi:hypothetical protein